MVKGISEILQETENFPAKADKIKHLRKFDTPALRYVLKLAFDPNMEFCLPPGKPDYKPSEFPDSQGVLYSRLREMYLFVEGGNMNLTQSRREMLFIRILETIDPADAELLCAVKDKTIPYRNFTGDLVNMAFPGLIPIPRYDRNKNFDEVRVKKEPDKTEETNSLQDLSKTEDGLELIKKVNDLVVDKKPKRKYTKKTKQLPTEKEDGENT